MVKTQHVYVLTSFTSSVATQQTTLLSILFIFSTKPLHPVLPVVFNPKGVPVLLIGSLFWLRHRDRRRRTSICYWLLDECGDYQVTASVIMKFINIRNKMAAAINGNVVSGDLKLFKNEDYFWQRQVINQFYFTSRYAKRQQWQRTLKVRIQQSLRKAAALLHYNNNIYWTNKTRKH